MNAAGGLLFPERRKRRRYLTLKNAAIAALSLSALCALLYAWPALRARFGGSRNLLQPRTTADVTRVVRPPYPIVREGLMPDRPERDWVIVEPDAKRASMPPAPPVTVPSAP